MSDPSIPPELREVILAAGPASWNATAPMSAEEHGAEFARMVRDTQALHGLDDSPRAVHWLSVKDGLSLAFVGSSPHSPHLTRALSGAWNRLHADCTQEAGPAPASEQVIAAAAALYDNRLGWSDGRNPYAPRELWDDLGRALGRDPAGFCGDEPAALPAVPFGVLAVLIGERKLYYHPKRGSVYQEEQRGPAYASFHEGENVFGLTSTDSRAYLVTDAVERWEEAVFYRDIRTDERYVRPAREFDQPGRYLPISASSGLMPPMIDAPGTLAAGLLELKDRMAEQLAFLAKAETDCIGSNDYDTAARYSARASVLSPYLTKITALLARS